MFDKTPLPPSSSSSSSTSSHPSTVVPLAVRIKTVKNQKQSLAKAFNKRNPEANIKNVSHYKSKLVRKIKEKLVRNGKKFRKRHRKRKLGDEDNCISNENLNPNRKKCKYNVHVNSKNCNTSNTNENANKYSTIETNSSDLVSQSQSCFLLFNDESTTAAASAVPTTTQMQLGHQATQVSANGFHNEYFSTAPLSINSQYVYNYDNTITTTTVRYDDNEQNSRFKQDLLKLSYDKFKLFRLNEKLLKQTVLTRNAIKLLQVEIQQQQHQQQQLHNQNSFVLNQGECENTYQHQHMNYNQQIDNINANERSDQQNENLLILKSSIKYSELINDVCNVYGDDEDDDERDDDVVIDDHVDYRLKNNLQNALVGSLHSTSDLMQLYHQHGLDTNNNGIAGITGSSVMTAANYYFVNETTGIHHHSTSPSPTSLVSNNGNNMVDISTNNPNSNVSSTVQTTTTHCVLVHAR
jgi:hypothetical protein